VVCHRCPSSGTFRPPATRLRWCLRQEQDFEELGARATPHALTQESARHRVLPHIRGTAILLTPRTEFPASGLVSRLPGFPHASPCPVSPRPALAFDALSFGAPVGALGIILVHGSSPRSSSRRHRAAVRVRTGSWVAFVHRADRSALAAYLLSFSFGSDHRQPCCSARFFGALDTVSTRTAARHVGARDINWMQLPLLARCHHRARCWSRPCWRRAELCAWCSGHGGRAGRPRGVLALSRAAGRPQPPGSRAGSAALVSPIQARRTWASPIQARRIQARRPARGLGLIPDRAAEPGPSERSVAAVGPRADLHGGRRPAWSPPRHLGLPVPDGGRGLPAAAPGSPSRPTGP